MADFTKKMTRQKKPQAFLGIMASLMGIVTFGGLSVYNGATHVLPMVEGDLVRALVFCAPFAIIGLVLEHFMDKAKRTGRHLYGLFIRLCALYGGLGFVLGVTFDTYDPFDWGFEWMALTLTAQVALEIAFIHSCWNWIKDLRARSMAAIQNIYWERFETDKQAISGQIERLEDRYDIMQAELEMLAFKNERAGAHAEGHHLLNSMQNLEDELDAVEAASDALAHKMKLEHGFQDNLATQA